jgi:hypothetical protein
MTGLDHAGRAATLASTQRSTGRRLSFSRARRSVAGRAAYVTPSRERDLKHCRVRAPGHPSPHDVVDPLAAA